MICFRCGHPNQEGQKFCSSCNAVLPRISESISAPPPERIDVHYNQLKEAGEKILAKLSTIDSFLETLDRVYNKIQLHLQEVENMEIEEEVRPSLQDQLETGILGINQFLEGIDEMRLFAQDSEPEHIRLGMESIFHGNENLNKALEMARDGIRRLKDMGIDSEINIQEKPVQ